MEIGTAEQIIRQLEQDLLDAHHRQLKLLQRDQTLAIAHVLKTHADTFRDLSRMTSPALSDVAFRTISQFLNGGTAHAARWLLTDATPRSNSSAVSWRALDSEATELIKWGSSYAELAQMHIVWSRGIVQANCDVAAKRIEFALRGEIDPTFMIGQGFSDEKWADYFFASIPEIDIARLFESWQGMVVMDSAGRQVPAAFVRRHPVFERLLSWAGSLVFRGIPELEDLGGFSRTDFLRWYAALFGHCRCICLDEDRTDSREGPINEMGSTCFMMAQAEAISWMAEAAGISLEAASHVLRTLRFNEKSVHSSLAAQPVIQTAGGTVLVSPRIFTQIHPERMLATAMIAGAGRRRYEAFVQRIESSRIVEVAEAVRGRGLQVDVDLPLTGTSDDSVAVTPDLIVQDSATDQVLVIEYKYCVPPLGAAAVANRLKDFDGWLSQLDDYATRMRQRLGVEKQTGVKGNLRRVLPLLLFGYPMPIPAVQPRDSAIGDWVSLSEFVNLMPLVRVRDIWKFASVRPDVAALVAGAKWTTRESQVGAWTYARPVLTLSKGEMPRWAPRAGFYDT